jgi:hypothetical protein
MRGSGLAGDLQPGEDVRTPKLSEARRWLETYDQLVWLKIDILGHAQRTGTRLPPRHGRDAENDLSSLRDELRWLEERRRFWEQRVLTLEARSSLFDS